MVVRRRRRATVRLLTTTTRTTTTGSCRRRHGVAELPTGRQDRVPLLRVRTGASRSRALHRHVRQELASIRMTHVSHCCLEDPQGRQGPTFGVVGARGEGARSGVSDWGEVEGEDGG